MAVAIQSSAGTHTDAPLIARYADELIVFSRKTRRESSKSVQIKVHPDCRIVALAPQSASNQDVIAAVEKRGRWISKQLKDFREQNKYVTPRKFVSGESHLYLGRQYQLKVMPASKQQKHEAAIKLFRGKLEVHGTDRSPVSVSGTLDSWYKARARIVFQQRLEHILPKTLWVSDPPPIRIFAMKTQWGNCSPAGRLTLNPHLVKAPTVCIDYVLLHELCHLAEHNHSERFYRLMSQVMPDWEVVKQRLDNMAGKLLY